jgi:hypothetical protein
MPELNIECLEKQLVFKEKSIGDPPSLAAVSLLLIEIKKFLF